MRILLVSDADLRRELGASKVVIELAEALERLGWACRLSSIPKLKEESPPGSAGRTSGRTALRAHLREHANEYDVVDYGHSYLPYPRSDFSPKMLLVARSILLVHHFSEIRIPIYPSWKERAHALVYGVRNRIRQNQLVQRVNLTMNEADLVNVANHDDEAVLVRHGIAKSKIIVLPYGLSQASQSRLALASRAAPSSPLIAFVGTFDARKGGPDFPRIVRRILAGVPQARFRLLGTYKSATDVLATFPSAVRSSIEVIPQYAADTLPELLAPCSVGIFPSYVEAFGFGVLEMLATGLPVIAYGAPGPPMMLPESYLVSPGDARAMGDKVVDLLNSPVELARARAWAKERALQFLWPDIARKTGEIYQKEWERRQG